MNWLPGFYQVFCLQILLFHFQISAELCSHDQSSTLLQFKQLFSFGNFIIPFVMEWKIPIRKWCPRRRTLISAHGMGTHVIWWQVMWLASTLVVASYMVTSLPTVASFAFLTCKDSILLTTTSITLRYRLALSDSLVWHYSTPLSLAFLVNFHLNFPTCLIWFISTSFLIQKWYLKTLLWKD